MTPQTQATPPPSQPMRPLPVELWGATDQGRQREGNEDTIYPESGAEFFQPSADKLAQKGQLLVVADGMGGTQAGGESSRWAIRVAVERYYDMTGTNLGLNLKAAIEVANNSLHQYLQSTGVAEAGCTMTAAVIHHNVLYVANVGDSRAYLLRNGKLTQLTRDHTVTQQKIDQGILTPEQAAADPERNVITRSMGLKPDVVVDLFPPIQLAQSDLVLLCSDGLTDMLADPAILGLLEGQPPKRAAKRLIDGANKQGGHDNISVVLAQIGGKPVAASAPGGDGALEQLASLPVKQLALLAIGLLLLLCVLAGIGWVLAGMSQPTQPSTATLPGVTVTREGITATPEALPPTATLPPADGRATSTPLPTFTPLPSPTPRPTARTPVPGVTESPATTGIQLSAPANGVALDNPVHFAWQGSLSTGQQFQIILQFTDGFEIIRLTEQSALTLDIPKERVGEWRWWVNRIGGGRILDSSQQRTFWFPAVNTQPPPPTSDPGPGEPPQPTPVPPTPTTAPED